MKLVADPEMAEWLSNLPDTPESFDWDAGNRTKNLKHGVTVEEIEAFLQTDFVFYGKIMEPSHSECRWIVLFENPQDRYLALIFTKRKNKLRPISCRLMRQKEKNDYAEIV